ncbi:MAG TPA: VWA domain-containing protein [Labilithrix sp.]
MALTTVVGCAKASTTPLPQTPDNKVSDEAALASDGAASSAHEHGDGKASSTWIGAAPEGDLLASGTRETFLGVWVDIPQAKPVNRPPMEVALVVDVSGSMAGSKIENARNAATQLVNGLRDGDIVALDAFSDHARTIVPPTRLDRSTRSEILSQISQLRPEGSTNIFEGLSLAEGQMQAAPQTHQLRRIVMISDGQANVGPSSPEILGSVAERGLRFHSQVTSFGIGIDYDERTLDALSVRSSGRLFHIENPEQTAKILKEEMNLLDGTVASDAFVEIVPAPGIAVEGADGVRTEWRNDGERPTLRIPLGALFAGQHREALVRVRITDPSVFEGHSRSVASVRLRFKDATEGDLERVQEVVARTALSNDATAVASAKSERANAIAAVMSASKAQLDAAQSVNSGNFVDADKELAKAQIALASQAQASKDDAQKKRLQAAADKVAVSRAATAGAAAAPAPAKRARALEINADAMHSAGF